MTMVQYWGTPNYNEKPLTGVDRLWTTGMRQDVPSTIAASLTAAGAGFQYDSDNIKGEPAIVQTDPLTGGGSAAIIGADRRGVLVSSVVIQPSGDTTGATDYANIAPLTLAGVDVQLTAGTYYFNNKIIRGFKRASDGTYVSAGWSSDAAIGNFFGAGSGRTTLKFLDTSKAGMEFWCRPEAAYRAAAPWVNTINGNSVVSVDRAPGWSGGYTQGFTIEGSAPNSISDIPTAAAAGWVDQYPNHVGYLVWGASGDHVTSDVTVKNFGVGRVLHDTTGFVFNGCKITRCGVGEALAIQWDGNVYNFCNTNITRVGTAFAWRGLYESSAYTLFGRESLGTYIPTPTSTQGQANTYNSCRWYACNQAALAGHDDPANTTADGALWSNAFNSCYFEDNALALIAPQNNTGGAWVFNECFFESFNTARAETLRLNQWFRDRMALTQVNLNAKFCPFTHWFGGGSSDDSLIKFSNCSIGNSDYGHVVADAWHVEIDRCKFPNGIGNTSGAIVTALGASRGFARPSLGNWWSPRTPINSSQGNDNWKLWAGFVSRNGQPYVSTTTGMSTPTASALWNGTQLMVTGATGVADLLYVCQKSTADTYSWKLLSTG